MAVLRWHIPLTLNGTHLFRSTAGEYTGCCCAGCTENKYTKTGTVRILPPPPEHGSNAVVASNNRNIPVIGKFCNFNFCAANVRLILLK
jgi:hypothetical protein